MTRDVRAGQGGRSDAWIATAERDALTASDGHRSVDYCPFTRYDEVGEYVNVSAPSTQEDVR